MATTPPDPPRESPSQLVYVAVSVKAEAVAAGYAADTQPRCSPQACANLDASAP